jgi:hypothetical protein
MAFCLHCYAMGITEINEFIFLGTFLVGQSPHVFFGIMTGSALLAAEKSSMSLDYFKVGMLIAGARRHPLPHRRSPLRVAAPSSALTGARRWRLAAGVLGTFVAIVYLGSVAQVRRRSRAPHARSRGVRSGVTCAARRRGRTCCGRWKRRPRRSRRGARQPARERA